jgi:predicted RNA binding protein YcfA (HicA-like mRNA interferase family)
MRYSRAAWQQLKNLTADDLISALERDGWKRDISKGAFIPFVDPATRKRVIIHYHPRKTYGPKLLKGLLEDAGWSEQDLSRIGLILGNTAADRTSQNLAGEVGDENPHGQLFARETDHPDIWVLLCRHCGSQYGTKGTEFDQRKCPKCQGGDAGIELA